MYLLRNLIERFSKSRKKERRARIQSRFGAVGVDHREAAYDQYYLEGFS